jgi:hypothetical protein
MRATSKSSRSLHVAFHYANLLQIKGTGTVERAARKVKSPAWWSLARSGRALRAVPEPITHVGTALRATRLKVAGRRPRIQAMR